MAPIHGSGDYALRGVAARTEPNVVITAAAGSRERGTVRDRLDQHVRLRAAQRAKWWVARLNGDRLRRQSWRTEELASDTTAAVAERRVFVDRNGRGLRAGTVAVNCYIEGDITTPFGGYRMSGFGGRDNGLEALEQYTEVKTIWITLH
jgi:Aldehyde dehydrogenase family